MNAISPVPTHGRLTAPRTITIQRVLPGTVERVWEYITDSELRRKWLAAGVMDLKADTVVEFVWRNDELTDPPGAKPADFGDEHRMVCRITAVEAPSHIAFTWGERGAHVDIRLESRGRGVLLTLVHSDLPDRSAMVGVSAGWHAHLDVLVALAEDRKPEPFWDAFHRVKGEYDAQIPAVLPAEGAAG